MFNDILFDLDGTLTDPGQGITNSVAFALQKFGIENTDRAELYKFIGPPLADSFGEFYGFGEADCLKAVEYYREYFREKGIFENRVYDGVPEMLSALKNSGKRLVLATSKPEKFAKTILEHFDLARFFDVVTGANMDGTRSKKGEVIACALNRCNITSTDNAVMVGDRKHDITGAKENGIASIGVLFGYGSREELTAAGADYIAASPRDLKKLITE